MTLTKKEQRETIWTSLGRINGLAKMIPLSTRKEIKVKTEKIQYLVAKITEDLHLLKVIGIDHSEYKN